MGQERRKNEDQCEGRKFEFDTRLRKSKLACPRSLGLVMRIGRTWRKLFPWIGSQ